MNNVISFCDYKQKKLDEIIEQELNDNDIVDLMMTVWADFPDDINFTTCTTTTFTLSVDDEVVYTTTNNNGDELEDE